MTEGPTYPGMRQTKTFLRELLEANGLSPRRQLGQNFLIDLNLLDLLVRTSAVGPEDAVLEIGAGTGGLTTRLAAIVGRVIAVEYDPGFFRLARQVTQDLSNVTIIHADALENKNKMNPRVMEAVANAMRELGATRFHLVANLPYDIATSVVGNLLLGDLDCRSLTVTVQFEVGERIVAAPGSKDYGPISALAQAVGSIEWIRTVPPDAFWPRPKVKSAFLRIVVDPERRRGYPDLAAWNRFVRDLFLHRRKNLRAAIASVPGYKRLKPSLDGMLQGLGVSPQCRAETLTPEELYTLYQCIRKLADETTDASPAPLPSEADS